MADKPYKNEKSNLHSGHRRRMKERFRKSGTDGFSDVEMLEMALFFAIAQGDTNEIAHRLINRFGSFSGVLDASYAQLTEVPGIGENAATFLRFITELGRRYRLDRIAEDNLFESPDKIGRYLLAYFMGSTAERTVLLCFDRKRRLLGAETVFADGMAEMTSARARRVAEIAIEHHAHGVVLAHNHPSGICEPSEYDITATNALDLALSGVEVHLIEHYVVTDEDYLGVKAYIRSHGYENA